MLRINLFHLSLPPFPSSHWTLAPNSPLRYFLPPRFEVGAEGGGERESSNRRNLKAGHFMMTTKVVRPPLGRRERGWQGETELLPLLFFLSLSVEHLRGRRKEGEREGLVGSSLPRGVYGCCSQGAWIDCFHYAKERKKGKEKTLHLSFLIPPPSYFF